MAFALKLPFGVLREEPAIEETFERIWRELGDRKERQEPPEVHRRIWLECDGDLVDASTVKVVGIRHSVFGVDMIQFVCPRCGVRHESIRSR